MLGSGNRLFIPSELLEVYLRMADKTKTRLLFTCRYINVWGQRCNHISALNTCTSNIDHSDIGSTCRKCKQEIEIGTLGMVYCGCKRYLPDKRLK